MLVTWMIIHASKDSVLKVVNVLGILLMMFIVSQVLLVP